VTVDHAVRILAEFLRVGLVAVGYKDKRAPPPTVEDACTTVAMCAYSAADRGVSPPLDELQWDWHSNLVVGTEVQSMDFMNLVAEAGFILARRSGAMDASSPKPSYFFSTSPRPLHAMPLPDVESGEDGFPDGFLLPIAALTRVTSMESHIIPPPTRTLWQQLRPLYWPDEQAALSDALPPDFSDWLERVKDVCGLDTSWICWPSIGASCECKLDNLSDAKAQVAIYMRLQRCTQPWRRFVLGFVATKNIFGLLRADPSGIEECTFDRGTSLGVIQVIRLCLGLSLANEKSLGLEDGFTLRETSCPSSVSSPTAMPKKRGLEREPDGSDEKDSKKSRADTSSTPVTPSSKGPPPPPSYRFPEVAGITLPDGTSLHVHNLVYDSGSLIGRCTRVFSVSRKMKDDAKTEFLRQNPQCLANIRRDVLDSATFWDGRFALKIIYSDVKSESLAENLEGEALGAGIAQLLLPEQYVSW
jgi:hypothetical protein